MRRSIVAALFLILTTLTCSPVSATDRVEVQSVVVATGYPKQIGIYLENDNTIRGVYCPLVIREVTPGCFMQSLTPQLWVSGSRLENRLNDILTTGLDS